MFGRNSKPGSRSQSQPRGNAGYSFNDGGASQQRVSGSPYLPAATQPSTTAPNNGPSAGVSGRTSQTFLLEPLRKSSRIPLNLPLATKQSYTNNNDLDNEKKKSSRVRITSPETKSGESSLTSLERFSKQCLVCKISKSKSSTDSSAATMNMEMTQMSDIINHNGNDSESGGEDNEPNSAVRMSRDIAKAVALIVAEYELLQQQQGRVDDDGGGISEEEKEIKKKKKPKKKDSNSNHELDGGTPGVNRSVSFTVAPKPRASVPDNTHDKEVKGGEVAAPAATTTTTTNAYNNNDSSAPSDGEEEERDKPENSSVGAAGKPEQLPVQELLVKSIRAKIMQDMGWTEDLPESFSKKLEPVTPVERSERTSKRDSTTTIGLDLPTVKKRVGPLVRCGVPPPATSREARMGGHAEVKRYLFRVQHYINSLGYHRDGEPDTSINVRLSMKTQMLTAKHLIHAGYPIKCLHAVVISVHLTNALDSVERFPIYFRSHVGDKEYKHIVLGIYCQGHYGAMGISRDVGLQDKKLIYTKLSDLIFEFDKCYTDSGHILNEVKLGTIITHDQSSLEKLFNKVGAIPIDSHSRQDIECNVEKMAKQLRSRMGIACLKSMYFDNNKRISPTPTLRRSRTNLNNSSTRNSNKASNNVSNANSSSYLTSAPRPRAISLGPNQVASLRFKKSDEKMNIPLSSKYSKTSTKVKKPKRVKQ